MISFEIKPGDTKKRQMLNFDSLQLSPAFDFALSFICPEVNDSESDRGELLYCTEPSRHETTISYPHRKNSISSVHLPFDSPNTGADENAYSSYTKL